MRNYLTADLGNYLALEALRLGRYLAVDKAGLDPTIGHLHVCQPGRDSFVYDLMEPHRPGVDRAVLDFVRGNVFTPRDFVIDAKGMCRLHPDLARRLASLPYESVGALPALFGPLRALGTTPAVE